MITTAERTKKRDTASPGTKEALLGYQREINLTKGTMVYLAANSLAIAARLAMLLIQNVQIVISRKR